MRFTPTIDVADANGVIVGMTMHKTDRKYAMRGSDAVYIPMLVAAIENIPKPATRLMFELVRIRGNMNILEFGSWASIGMEVSQDRSQVIKSRNSLTEHNIIREYNGKFFLNPFLVLPKYDKVDENNQWRSQMLWRHLFENKDLVYNGIEEDMAELGLN